MPHRNASISIIVIAAIVAVTTLFLGAFGFVNYRADRDRQFEQFQRDLTAATDQIATALVLPVWNFDRPQIEKVMESAMQDRQTLGIAIRLDDAQKTLMAMDRDAQWNVRLASMPPSREGAWVESRSIASGSQNLGRVEIFASPKFVRAELRRSLHWRIVNVLMLDFIMTVSLYFLLWHWVFKPLKRIEAYAVAVSDGNSAAAEIPGETFHGELESLRAHLRKMVEQLEARFRELREETQQRKRTETALVESESKYRTLFDSANDAILLSDGTVLECNSRCLEMFGWSREELLGNSVEKLFPPLQDNQENTASLLLEIRGEVMAGRPRIVEFKARRQDGSLFDIESSLRAVTFLGRKVLMAIIRDITERKSLEKALVENETKYRTLFDSATDAILVAEKGRILDCNSAALALFGARREDLIGQPGTAIMPERQADGSLSSEGMERFRDAALAGVAQRFEWTHRRIDGTLFETESSLNFVTIDGRPRLLVVFRDISGRKRAQEAARLQQQQLVQADKMNSLGMMVSGVAHEINNPNNLIMLNADVLETFWRHMRPVMREWAAAHPDWKLAGIPYDKAEGKYESLIQGLSGGSKRIQRIVEHLKDFARLDPGEVSESVALEKVIEASVGIVEHLIRKSTDHFSVVHGDGVPRIKGNFQKLEQVVINLITNACQSLENRGKAIRIAIQFDAAAREVVLTVEDEGKGIAEELLHRVADPFFTTKRDTGGTGLGLSVSYGIIQEHRGRIHFRSQVDQGTSVEIRIPALAE